MFFLILLWFLFTLTLFSETLVYANLATNFFRSLPASVASAPSLVLLNISSNSLTSPLPTLTSSYLETLDASRNFLRAIPRLSNESAASLQHLILAHNAISKLEKDQLQDLSQLLTVRFHWNVNEFDCLRSFDQSDIEEKKQLQNFIDFIDPDWYNSPTMIYFPNQRETSIENHISRHQWRWKTWRILKDLQQ